MTLTIQNINIKVKSWKLNNSNPTIIFLHDSFGCIELWRDYPKKIGEAVKCNVIAYDRQGYGQSDALESDKRENNYMEKEADVLIKIMDALKIQKAILFGHSDGGTIALIAAAKYPSRILGIIAEAAHIFVEKITIKGIKATVAAFYNSNLKLKLRKHHGNKTDLLFSLWSDTWLSEKFKSWNIENLLPNIQCPVLVIQGENDEFGTKSQVNTIVSKVKGHTEKFKIPCIGHSPHKEAAELTIKKTTNFIKSIMVK